MKPISVVSDLKCGKMKIESIRILPPVCLKIKTNSNAQKDYRMLALFEPYRDDIMYTPMCRPNFVNEFYSNINSGVKSALKIIENDTDIAYEL